MKRIGHALQAAALAGLAALVERLPYASALAVGRALGGTIHGLGVRRAVVLDNLRQAFPEWDAARIARTARACYRIWGQAMVDYLRVPRPRGAAALAEVMEPPRGMDYVAQARRTGKGVILLSAHFGGFELLGASVAAQGFPVSFLVQRQSNAWVERRLERWRRAVGVGTIGRGSQLREALRALAANRCVALAADQDARGRGVFVDFFGRPSSTPMGPALLSLRTGAPIVMGFLVRGADGRHRGTVLPPLEFTPSGDFDADVAALTQRHAAILEEWVRRHPDHWYWLHRRWKTEPPAERRSRAGDPATRTARIAGGMLALALVGAAASGAAGFVAARHAPPAGASARPPAAASRGEEPAGPERADATTFGGAGSSLVPLAETRVARVIEDLLVRRDHEGWSVDEVDVFQAGAAPEVVPIGWPDFQAETDTGQAQPTLSEVRLLADGVEVAAVIEPPPAGNDLPGLGGIGRLFEWRVRFDSDDRRLLRLHYRVRSSRTERGEELLFYYLNTGTPWRGPSGRVNARFELGELSSEDLVAGWLRPDHFGVSASAVTWVLTGEEPEEDLVVALRPPEDSLFAFPAGGRGPLTLSPPEREEWVARGTPREWRFWRAYVRALLGETPGDSVLAARVRAASWFRPRPANHLRKATRAEAALLASLDRRLSEWEGHRIPAAEDTTGR